MGNSGMSVVITKNDLDIVVSRASLAAMSEEGQSAISRANNETKGCVRVTASGNKIMFDSSVSRFSSRYVVTIGEGSEEVIESEGSTCIPAKELKSVSGKIKDGKIRLTFVAMPAARAVNASASTTSMLSDGVVEVSVLKGAKHVAKAKIEAYPATYFSCPDFQGPESLRLVMSGKASDLKDPFGLVSFAINENDTKEVYNKLGIFPAQDAVFFLGSDGRRGAMVERPVKGKDGEPTGIKVMEGEALAPILIDSEFITPIMSSVDIGAEMLLAMDETEDHIYMFFGETTYRISMAEKLLRKKFPHYQKIIALKKKAEILIDRKELSQAIDLLGIVNIDRGRYRFCRSERVIRLLGRGVATVKEATGEVTYEAVSQAELGDGDIDRETISNPEIHLHTGYLIDGLKKMSSDKVRMIFTPDELKVRIEDATDPKFYYFMQVMNPSEV